VVASTCTWDPGLWLYLLVISVEGNAFNKCWEQRFSKGGGVLGSSLGV
jgi:hypothetical protein